MIEHLDKSGARVAPPIPWLLALGAGWGLHALYPASLFGAAPWAQALGAVIFAAGLLFALWAITRFRRAGTNLETYKPTTAIVESGPFRLSRNPIYVGMFLGLIGAAIGLDNPWILLLLAPFYLYIRHEVVAREEAYLERKFGDAYLGYKARVRRWL